MAAIRKLLALFSADERRRLFGVIAAMLATGMLQVVGVGSVMPFVALLRDRSLIQEHAALTWVYESLNFASTDGFLVFVGASVLCLLVAGNAFIAFTVWLIARFAWANQRRLSTRLLRGYLHQPYEAFLNRNTADTGKNILVESQQFTNGVLVPALNAVAFGITALFIAAFLVWLSPLLAAFVGVVFVSAYALVYVFVRRPLLRIGQRRMRANTRRFQATGEAFGSLKEVKVMGREQAFIRRYEPAAASFANTMAKQQVLGQLPRYLIEAIAFGMVIGLFLVLLASGSEVQAWLPLASVFGVAGYRLLPALQRIYQGMSQWRFNQTVLDTLYRDLMAHDSETRSEPEQEPLQFQHSLRLEDVSYHYPGTAEPALKNISLEIPRNAFVAFIGATGAGKTTVVDLILGLLPPSSGRICIDDTPITAANRRQWQANIGYVPQEIYLTDDTIRANIAYGLSPEDIDQTAVEKAARIANIHGFITQHLPSGYDTEVGERGVRLSGGQRQRIGIARALYHDPQVLVLDEATSSLDNETERRIVEELDSMRGGRTLIVIAHRLSTVRYCGCLYLLADGRVLASGAYDELVDASLEFRRLTRSQAVGE